MNGERGGSLPFCKQWDQYTVNPKPLSSFLRQNHCKDDHCLRERRTKNGEKESHRRERLQKS